MCERSYSVIVECDRRRSILSDATLHTKQNITSIEKKTAIAINIHQSKIES